MHLLLLFGIGALITIAALSTPSKVQAASSSETDFEKAARLWNEMLGEIKASGGGLKVATESQKQRLAVILRLAGSPILADSILNPINVDGKTPTEQNAIKQKLMDEIAKVRENTGINFMQVPMPAQSQQLE